MKRDLRDMIGEALVTRYATGGNLPLGEMAEGDELDTVRLEAGPIGEMGADLDSLVPAGRGIDVAAIKQGDDDPLEVVVSLDAGKSKRGIHYTEKALGEIANVINNKGGLPGYLGHQKAEDINTQFATPVTHWIGAKQQGKTFLFRGVIDQKAEDLKRWIRSKRITQTSIFGIPKLARSMGEIKATGYEAISIDWTPLHRAGMPSAIVALGEMDQILKPGEKPDEVVDKGKGGKRMELAEWLAEGRAIKAPIPEVIGEMGWQPSEVVKHLEGIEILSADDAAAVKAIGEMYTELGLEDKGTPAERLTSFKTRVNELLELDRKAREDAHGETIKGVLGEMVAQKEAHSFLESLVAPRLDKGADKAKVEEVVGEMLKTEDVKRALKGFGVSSMSLDPQGGSTTKGNEGSRERSVPAGARVRKARI